MTQNNFQSDHTIAVCIDGRSVAWASGSGKKFDFEKIRSAVDYFESLPAPIRILLFIPSWIDDEDFRAEMKIRTELHLVTGINGHPSRDDHYALMEMIRLDGFLVTNDKKMYDHIYNSMIPESYIKERTISFKFKKGKFKPNLPQNWIVS